MLYWVLKLVIVGPIVRFLFRPWVEGAQHVPAHGPAILASNHLSFSDSIFLPLILPRRVTFPAKMEYFTSPGLKGRLKAAFFRGTGQIPIDRSGGEASQAAMRAGLEVLRRGELFGIYPEGTRSPDGRLHRGKTGMARLALEAGVPIIPVAMIDTDKAQPTGQKIPNIVRVGVRFAPPIDLSPYQGREDDYDAWREITDQVMAELARLSGREYVDEYAATRKQQIAARAEQFMANAKADAAAAQARAEELVATARAETLAATARARIETAAMRERAKVETAAVRERAKVETAAVRERAKVETAAVQTRAEELVGRVTRRMNTAGAEETVDADELAATDDVVETPAPQVPGDADGLAPRQ
ncbi:lysophospholipid acyltransferase family protein [Gephyromycinifex aptenodytis]|uniref:lysophospholipid acyltransferase family protein n=1 Tax=Gephyromycinifex aptenodytis TaxID=2716227 RepID=UPI001446FB87|nr:lysophospholipid acyltransferase family protein [Gephyromycinifex aptenodytis]